MSPVRFWDRDVDQHDRTNPHRGRAAHSWDPEGAPDAEGARIPEDFDEARDELLTGQDIYDGDWWNEIVRHPSRTVRHNIAGASYPAPSTGTPCLEPIGVPAPEGFSSSLRSSGATSSR